jgi:hypothetical protein
MITLDCHGDLVLELQDRALQVSSKVLRLSSPFFAAMLKSTFKEGTQHCAGSNEPSVVPLPDEDPDAFLLYCQIIHFQDVPSRPLPVTLAQLALLCDKYDISKAVIGWSRVWLQSLAQGDASAEDLSYLLILAYVLDLREAFFMISKAIVLSHVGAFHVLPFSSNPLIRDGLVGKQQACSLISVCSKLISLNRSVRYMQVGAQSLCRGDHHVYRLRDHTI